MFLHHNKHTLSNCSQRYFRLLQATSAAKISRAAWKKVLMSGMQARVLGGCASTLLPAVAACSGTRRRDMYAHAEAMCMCISSLPRLHPPEPPPHCHPAPIRHISFSIAGCDATPAILPSFFFLSLQRTLLCRTHRSSSGVL